MRLDKYLKVSRIIKRRTVAKEVADQGRVEVNGQVAKSGTQLKIDDVLTITFGQRRVSYKVLKLQDSAKKDDAETMYEIINEERIDG